MFKRSMEFVGKVFVFFLLVLSCSFFCGMRVQAYTIDYFDAQGYQYQYDNDISAATTVIVPLSDATLVSTDSYNRRYFYRHDFVQTFSVNIMSLSGEFFHGDRPTSSFIGYTLSQSVGTGSQIDAIESSFTAPGVYAPLSPTGGWFEAGSDSTPTSIGYVNFTVYAHSDIEFTVSNSDKSSYSSRTIHSYYRFSLGQFITGLSASPLMSTVLTINDNVIRLLNDQGLTGAINNQTNVIQGGINQAHQDMSSQTSVIQQGQQQAHQDMDKVNNSLTNFAGSAALDASKGQLDGVIDDYDQIEGSLFDSGQAAFDKFDPSSLLSFSAGIVSAMGYISQLMVGIISAMGEFSSLYTVGFVLVFFGMLIGLWRFFVDD